MIAISSNSCYITCIYIVMCLPGNTSVISGSGFIISIYWINCQVELQLIITLWISLCFSANTTLQSHLKSSQSEHSESYYKHTGLILHRLIPDPNSLSCFHASCCISYSLLIAFTSYLELAESYFELKWLRTPTELKTVFILACTKLNWNWLHLELII
jgi:hypothetical protein